MTLFSKPFGLFKVFQNHIEATKSYQNQSICLRVFLAHLSLVCNSLKIGCLWLSDWLSESWFVWESLRKDAPQSISKVGGHQSAGCKGKESHPRAKTDQNWEIGVWRGKVQWISTAWSSVHSSMSCGQQLLSLHPSWSLSLSSIQLSGNFFSSNSQLCSGQISTWTLCLASKLVTKEIKLQSISTAASQVSNSVVGEPMQQ